MTLPQLRLPPAHSAARPRAVLAYTWAGVALLLCIDLLWLHVSGMSFPWLPFGKPLLPTLALFGIASAVCARMGNAVGFMFAQNIMLILCGVPLLVILSYLGASLNMPAADAGMVAADHALGLDWQTYVRWESRHPLAMDLLTSAYRTMAPQGFILLWVFAMTKRTLEMQRLVLAGLLGILFTVIFAALWPVMGGYIFYHLSPADMGLHVLGPVYAHDLLAMRDGTLHEIPIFMKGLIQFPSFHTSFALMLIWVSRSLTWWFVPSVVLNVLLILATPADGGHYFMDIAGGIAVACVCIRAASVLLPGKAA